MNSMIKENGVTFKELEKNIYAWVCQIGREFTKEFLERYDRMLMEDRDKKKYRNKGARQTTVKTVYGEVTYQRMVYEVIEEDGTKRFVYLLDETLELTVDEEGYLSRPVSSVMMIYPVIVPNDKAIVGEVLSMTFKAYNDKGKSGSIKSSFKIVNYVRNTSWLWLYKLAGKIQGSMFFNPAKYKAYSNSSFGTHKDEIDVAAYTASDGKHYFLNPAHKETQALYVADGMNYDASTMRATKFIPLDNVNFDLVGDTELEQMDFSKAVDKIEVTTGSVIGFENQDGRRGIMNVKISSSIYPTLQCKFQAVAKKQE